MSNRAREGMKAPYGWQSVTNEGGGVAIPQGSRLTATIAEAWICAAAVHDAPHPRNGWSIGSNLGRIGVAPESFAIDAGEHHYAGTVEAAGAAAGHSEDQGQTGFEHQGLQFGCRQDFAQSLLNPCLGECAQGC